MSITIIPDCKCKPVVADLLAALRMNAQALAWLAHGERRGFHDGLPTTKEALDAARTIIAKVRP